MDASHLADLHVQRMSLWLLNVDSVMAIFRGALAKVKWDRLGITLITVPRRRSEPRMICGLPTEKELLEISPGHL